MYSIKNGRLYCEGLALSSLAETFGTPLYVYSLKQLETNIKKVRGAFASACPEGMVCYAVKANGHKALLDYFSREGLGFDIVSHGEMLKVWEVQGHLNNVLYSGSAKSASEILAALERGLFMLNAESFWELQQASAAAQALHTVARVSLRVNPYVDPKTHKNISTGVRGAKFGIPKDRILEAARTARSLKGIELTGLSCHIGSMVAGETPFLEMLSVLHDLAQMLLKEGIPLQYIDLGGGFPIHYTDEREIDYAALFTAYHEALSPLGLKPLIEPGRSLSGNAGALLARVIHIKESGGVRFAFLDTGFTELIRPALYEAVHHIIPLISEGGPCIYTVAGPICESTDVFAEGIPLAITEGAYVLIENGGAYGACMASNYNARPKPAEVLVNGDKHLLLTPRQEYGDIWKSEADHF